MKLNPEQTKQLKDMVDQYGVNATLKGYLKSQDVDRAEIVRDVGRRGAAMAFQRLFGISPGGRFEEKKPGTVTTQTVPTGAKPDLKRGQTMQPAVQAEIAEVQDPDIHAFTNDLIKLSKSYNTPLPLILAMVKAESQFDPTAKGTSGERGLLQLMPKTAQAMGLTVSSKQDDRLDPMKNIESALKYMKTLRTRYGAKTIDQVLAGYNAGPSRIKGDSYKGIPSTVQYIKKIRAAAQQYESDPNMVATDLIKLHSNIKGLNP